MIKRASLLHAAAIRREIPEPGGPPDPRLRLPAVYPSGVIEDPPLAQTYRVPTGRRMVPIAGQHAWQRRAAHIQIGGVVGPERDFPDPDALEVLSQALHVLSPVEIRIGYEIFGVAAGDFVGVRQIV